VEGQEGGAAPVDMTSLARTAFAEVATSTENPGEVRFELSDLPPGRGNSALLGRVFSNLLSNAVKYTRRRPDRRIVVSGEAGVAENVYRVADNGSGLDPKVRDGLFQPFPRGWNNRGAEGTGLGLAIVARIIRKHGGRIW